MYLKRTIKEKTASHNNALTGNAFIDRILQNRSVQNYSELEYEIRKLLPPWTMQDIDNAVNSLIKHITNNSKILIVGDYDCDGATSTTIAVEGLRMCGAKNVEFVVPDRMIHGYGLTPSIIKDIEHLKPEVIVTVDNGVSSFDGADAVYALSHPCELIVTDHHLPSDKGLPRAEAIVNPSRFDCQFPSKNIAGCGVIFYVIMALRAKMRDTGVFNQLGIPNPNLKKLLDVLAVGTVADLVTLDENNRNIVSLGLEIINQCKARPGIMALAKVAGKEPSKITATDIGFGIAPRINAAGRMADMTIGIHCLLSKNYDEAMRYARELDQLNIDRKETQKTMMSEADDITNIESSADGVIVYKEDWHEGVIGILASQIKEKLNRPVICFTKTEPQDGEEVIKGSARSVKGIHLKHVLDEMSVSHPEVFKKFGGHAMAAGLSIPATQLESFTRLFDQYISKHMTDEIRQGLIYVDIDEVPATSLTIANAKKIEELGPWGQNFELPLFAGTFDVISWKILKEKHLKLVLKKDHVQVEGIAFNCIDEGCDVSPYNGKIKIIFKMDINRWNGKENLQLMIDYIENVEVNLSETVNKERKFIKDGASRQNRNMEEACKIFNSR